MIDYREFLLERRKNRRLWIILCGLCTLAVLTLTLFLLDNDNRQQHSELYIARFRRRILLQTAFSDALPKCGINSKDSSDGGGQFIRDPFSMETRRNGAIVFHFFGLMYMFVALAIVCDEYFVPTLGVISEKFAISDDVAGATFMAAGGSAPEFFTSLIGVFISQDNVGIGTIVGSATFNILCVLAFCTLFSRGVLILTWWPLFRDVTFYVVALVLIVYFFYDGKIYLYEAIIMLAIYIAYCLFMKYNECAEFWVKTNLLGQTIDLTAPIQPVANDLTSPVDATLATSTAQAISRPSSVSLSSYRRTSMTRRQSIPILHSGVMFRNGIMQLMVHTLDPLSELHVNDRMGRLKQMSNFEHSSAPCPPDIDRLPEHSISRYKPNGSIDLTVMSRISSSGGWTNQAYSHDTSFPNVPGTPEYDDCRKPSSSTPNAGSTPIPMLGAVREENEQEDYKAINGQYANAMKMEKDGLEKKSVQGMELIDGSEIVEEEPLDMSWPSTYRKRIIYIILAPIMFPLWVTMADVRRPESRKYFILTFILSIMWIAFFSYLMVWIANTIGYTLSIPTEIMGLTLLATGTSIPDLLTSVIVARKGLGDMAVSSSIGSNIFDICVGLPIPWILFFGVGPLRAHYFEFILVGSRGLVCSVGMLFVMLILLVLSIGLNGWKMNKTFGFIMIIAYCVFCIFSVLLETNQLKCFLQTCQ